MGVFTLKTGILKKDIIEKIYLSRGHKGCINSNVLNTNILYSGKILKSSENHLKFENGEIFGFGFFLYKSSFGKEALKKIFDDFDINTFKFADDIYGHYAIVIQKNDTIYIFNDRAGMFRLYYYVGDNNIVVSTSLLSVISQIDEPSIDKVRMARYLECGLGSYIPFVNGMEMMNPELLLEIESDGTYRFINKPTPQTPKHITTLNDAVAFVEDLLQKQSKQLNAIKDYPVSVELTGGLDSRLLSSFINNNGFQYDFVHYPLFGPDREVAEFVSSAMGKELKLIPHFGNGSDLDNDWGEFDFMYNFYRHYPSKRWTTPNSFQFSGLHGECISNSGYLEKNRSPVLIDNEDVIRIKDSVLRSEYIEKYLRHFYEQLQSIGIESNVKLSQLQLYSATQYVYPRTSGDSAFISAQNAHQYFYSLYNEWNFVYNVSNIDLEVKDGRRLDIALIKDIDDKLAGMPIVSRRRTKIESVKNITSLPSQYKSYNKVKELMPKYVLNFLFGKMGRSFDHYKLKTIRWELYEDVLQTNKLRKYPNLYHGTLNHLYSLEQIRKKLNF